MIQLNEMEKITFKPIERSPLKGIPKDPTSARRRELCNEIYETFQRKIPYGQICGLCKLKGENYLRETYEQYQKQPIQNVAYFLGMVKSVRVELTSKQPNEHKNLENNNNWRKV